jgi:tetratricopeptide (TPR) repeat protein
MEQACPEAGILAAFAEGALAPEKRNDIERHVSNCPECPVVIGEVTRFLAESGHVNRGYAFRKRWGLIAATIGAIGISIAAWRVSLRDPVQNLRRIAADSPERTYEGRLHDFAFTRFRSPRGDVSSPVPIELQAEVENLARWSQDAEVLHARGIAALLAHDPREAARLMDAAIRLAPNRAESWSDLAVAELARARLDDRLLPSALLAADRAVALAPSWPDTHYNRGIVLEQLGRDAEAIRAYRTALAHETSERWRDEIRSRLQRLENDR